jgi:plastocyanin
MDRYTGGAVRSAIMRAPTLAALAVTLVAAACSSSSGGSGGSGGSTTTGATSGSSGAQGGVTMTIETFDYGAPLSVAPGTQITVVNKDTSEHTVTSNTAGQFNADVSGDQTTTFTAPAAAGTYQFHCVLHPFMHGTLTVKR